MKCINNPKAININVFVLSDNLASLRGAIVNLSTFNLIIPSLVECSSNCFLICPSSPNILKKIIILIPNFCFRDYKL